MTLISCYEKKKEEKARIQTFVLISSAASWSEGLPAGRRRDWLTVNSKTASSLQSLMSHSLTLNYNYKPKKKKGISSGERREDPRQFFVLHATGEELVLGQVAVVVVVHPFEDDLGPRRRVVGWHFSAAARPEHVVDGLEMWKWEEERDERKWFSWEWWYAGLGWCMAHSSGKVRFLLPPAQVV